MDPNCPKCGGGMWDNRVTKRNPKAPDYKCKSRSCDGVVWPGKEEARDYQNQAAYDAMDTPGVRQAKADIAAQAEADRTGGKVDKGQVETRLQALWGRLTDSYMTQHAAKLETTVPLSHEGVSTAVAAMFEMAVKLGAY